ncbi:hypothetical protein GGP79_001130 [Salinibacter ruber]|uniref:hypothetical protein n=1 Tax=Salinibacter ruber TaxID=146919 RepID=UPI00216A0633|nr:hypothetical protein [Salinibacter ruber]MCS3753185.1 hypothetical protein [Salinibacter ruber]
MRPINNLTELYAISKRIYESLKTPSAVVEYVKSPNKAKEKYNQIRKETRLKKEFELKIGKRLSSHWALVRMVKDEDEFIKICRKAFRLTKSYKSGKLKQIRKISQGKEFIIIIGSERTGGSYVKHHLVNNISGLTTNDEMIIQEGIPEFKFLANSSKHHDNCLYQLMLWLVWIDMKYKNQTTIVKKSAGFPYAYRIVQSLLARAKLTTIITTRHPGAIYRSSVEGPKVIPIGRSSYLFGERAPEWWRKAGKFTRVLHFWHLIYGKIATNLDENTKQDANVIRYGNQEDAIKKVLRNVTDGNAPSAEKDMEDDPFVLTKRNYSSFWTSRVSQSVIRDTKRLWQNQNMRLPIDPENIK